MNRYDFDFGLAPVRSDAVRRSVLATPPRTRFEPKTPSRAHYERVPIRKTHPVTKKESVPPPTVEYAGKKAFCKTFKSARGRLKKDANPDLIKKEELARTKAMKAKHQDL